MVRAKLRVIRFFGEKSVCCLQTAIFAFVNGSDHLSVLSIASGFCLLCTNDQIYII
jgi:hypothetical protein